MLISLMFKYFSVTLVMPSDVPVVHTWECQLLNQERKSAYQKDSLKQTDNEHRYLVPIFIVIDIN